MKENYSPPQFGAREAVRGALCLPVGPQFKRDGRNWRGHWWAGKVAGAEGTQPVGRGAGTCMCLIWQTEA